MTGYIYLSLTILTTAWITIGLRELKRWDIRLLQAITWNYIAAASFGAIRSPQSFSSVASEPIALYTALYLGLAFITLFFLMGLVAQKVGLGYMTIFTKMSMVIPTIFAWLYYHEDMNIIKGLGIILAMTSVVLINYRPNAPIQLSNKSSNRYSVLLIVFLFVGSGINDLLFKIFNTEYSDTISNTDFPVVIFTVAAIVGIIACTYQIVTGKAGFEYKAIFGGLVIGVPNYFSIFFLVESLEHFPGTVFFPVNNIALLAVTALAGLTLYKEHFNLYNFAGLVLAVLSVLLLV